MIRHHVASAFALLALVAAPVGAAPPLAPTGKWNVDYGEAHCVAMRSFGTAQKPVTLAIKPAPIGDVTQLTIVHPRRSREMSQYRGTLTFDRGAPQPVSLVGYPGADPALRVTTANLPHATYDLMRGASSIRLFSPGEVEEAFALSDMVPVAKALDECIADLQQVWHLGPASAGMRQPARSLQPLSGLLSSDDYPGPALHGNSAGAVKVMLLINEAGRIASCGVTETSGVASLDTQTCIVLTRRARFSPAIGPDGKPAKGGVEERVQWKLG